jgi:hypothetical protein
MPISHPFRLAGGRIATIDEGSARLASELAGAVLATMQAERGLAPRYGIRDPTGGGIEPDELGGWVEINEPEITVKAITATWSNDGTVAVRATVAWGGR